MADGEPGDGTARFPQQGPPQQQQQWRQGPPPQQFPQQQFSQQWAAPGPAPQGQWQQQGPPTGRRRRLWPWIVVVAVLLLVLAAAAGVGFARWRTDSQNREQITTAGADFTRGALAGDRDAVRGLLCDEEGAAFDTTMGPADPDEEKELADPSMPVSVTDVDVRDDVAKAQVSVQGAPAKSLYFRKESGSWKVCDPARPTYEAGG